MKAILEFNLPEEKLEHSAAVHGLEWALVCWELDQDLRRLLKYGNNFKSADEAVENIRETLRRFIDESGLNLEETIS